MSQRPRFKNTPIAAAVAAILFTAPSALAQEEQLTLEEVLVTARKRTESVQDIPASIMAISADDLKYMGAQGIDDYSRFIPSLNVVTYGAGSSIIVFRGATIDAGGYVAQSTSSLYLDEVSITSTGDQPSVRMVDIARVEALAGPQGTLYGSDAQAGTLRIITNKPVMNEFEITVDGTARTMSEGDNSYEGSIVLNLPLIDDTLALRLVAFDSKDGGFIDNVPGHTPDTSALYGAGYFPSGYGTLDNAHAVEDDWNEVETSGWRASLRWEINDNWAATVMAVHQETDSGASNDYNPYVGDLEIIKFYDDWTEDEYDVYSLTIEGDLGFAQLVSATSYYDRDGESITDSTVYHHYWNAAYCYTFSSDVAYYYASFPEPGGSGVIYNAAYCMAPTIDGDYLAAYPSQYQQERFTQEFRLSSSGDTLDWLVGLFYEDSTNSWQDQYTVNLTNDYQDSVAAQYWEWAGVDLPAEGQLVPWDDTSETDWEQTAVFGEVVWHVTDQLNLTLGGRYFDRENTNYYILFNPTTNPADEYVDGRGVHKGDETEFVPKIAVSYDLNDDMMMYALWTEGYKPGGTNRSRGDPFFPRNYFADKMTNYELGYRGTFSGGAGRGNITAFYMDWEDFQLEIVDPSFGDCPAGGPNSLPGQCGQPWQNVVANAGDAHILGVTMELDWALTDGLVVGMNAEWLEAETDSNLDVVPGGGFEVQKGQSLPITPEWSGAAWATYSWPVARFDGTGYARLQWSYMGSTLNDLEPRSPTESPNPQIKSDSYDIGDLSVGLQADTWEVSVFVHNITDERATLTNNKGAMGWGSASSTSGVSHFQERFTNRPREYGLRIIKRWGGS